MKIAVYGCNGFVGSILVPKLLNKGYKVIGFDNGWQPTDSLFSIATHPNFEYRFCNIIRESDVIKSFESNGPDKYPFDNIILLSGVVGVPACNDYPADATFVNDVGWSYICKHKPDQIGLITANTGSIYGSIPSGLCTEETETIPLSHYGITKLAGEKHVLATNNGISLRFSTAAGCSPRFRLNLLPNELVFKAIKEKQLTIFEPDFRRSFIDVRDFADSLIFFIENQDKLKYRVFNVGCKENNWSKRQLAELIKSKTKCQVLYNNFDKDLDARDYAIDFSRLNETGFYCKYDVPDIVESLLKVMPLITLKHQYYE